MLFKRMADSEHVQRFKFRALGPLSRFFWAVDQFRHQDGPTNLVVENEKCHTRAPYCSIMDGRISRRKPLRVKHGTHYFVRQLHHAAGGVRNYTPYSPLHRTGDRGGPAAVGLIEKL